MTQIKDGPLKFIEKADLEVCDESSSFLQSGFWGSFKARFGWEALAFRLGWENSEKEIETRPLLVLRRKLLPLFSLAYIPWGPELPSLASYSSNEAVLELAEKLKNILPADTCFIRFDPPWYTENTFPKALPSPFICASSTVQPPDTVILDLSMSMEQILKEMKPKWRYNARLALKKGVKISRGSVNDIQKFYELLKTTAKRDGISIHSLEYYKTLFDNYIKSPDLRIYLAEHEGEVISAIITLFRGGEAYYLYGASSDNKRNLMASYALQVKAIEDAINENCLIYDFFGIPPNEDPNHPMAGLYRFKTGFGGKIIHRPGSYDYPCRPFLYFLFRYAEALRVMFRIIKRKNTPESSL